jgi:hypothetical protein
MIADVTGPMESVPDKCEHSPNTLGDFEGGRLGSRLQMALASQTSGSSPQK